MRRRALRDARLACSCRRARRGCMPITPVAAGERRCRHSTAVVLANYRRRIAHLRSAPLVRDRLAWQRLRGDDKAGRSDLCCTLRLLLWVLRCCWGGRAPQTTARCVQGMEKRPPPRRHTQCLVQATRPRAPRYRMCRSVGASREFEMVKFRACDMPPDGAILVDYCDSAARVIWHAE